MLTSRDVEWLEVFREVLSSDSEELDRSSPDSDEVCEGLVCE